MEDDMVDGMSNAKIQADYAARRGRCRTAPASVKELLK